MNILVIEDEERVSSFISRGLQGEGWSTTVAGDGETGLQMARTGTYDVILLDIMLPGISGHEVCTILRATGNLTPILMLTALSEADERVAGLRKGADDYLAKPFSFDELIARIEALHRRASVYDADPAQGATMGTAQDEDPVRLDRDALCLIVDGSAVELSTKERQLFALLESNKGRALSRERILNSVWGLNEDPLTNTVDVYVGRLRRKLGPYSDRITTLRGAGYRYDTHK